MTVNNAMNLRVSTGETFAGLIKSSVSLGLVEIFFIFSALQVTKYSCYYTSL